MPRTETPDRSTRAGVIAAPAADAAGEQIDTVILGGGVCGLYAALTLARAGHSTLVLEKNSVPGGLAAGRRRGRNFYDFGVHMLHSFDREIFETISGLMGEERIEVALDARIRWEGASYRYPLQFGDMIRGMPATTLLHCCAGLLAQPLRNRITAREPANAEEALIQLYGAPLYRFFFRNFTRRYWGIPPHQLSARFITEKMPRLSAIDAIRKLFAIIGIVEKKDTAGESALLEETLHYSRSGAEALPRCLVREIETLGSGVRTAAEVTRVHLSNGRVAGVSYRDAESGSEHRLACDNLISTIPLPDFVGAMDGGAPPPVTEAAAHLRYKPIAVYGLLVKKPRALDGLYVYYRDRIFHRIGEPKNAGLLVDPPDHTVLIVETTCDVDDERWQADKSAVDAIIAGLEAENICKRHEIVEVHPFKTAHGYPVFTLGFETHRDSVNRFIDSIENAQSTGRQGAFCYPNMHSAMRMGKEAAEKIVGHLANKTP